MSTPLVTAILSAPRGTDPRALADALASVLEQEPRPAVLIATDGDDRAIPRAVEGNEHQLVEVAGAPPAGLRNAAWAKARTPYVVLLEANERLAPGALARHVAALEADATAVASYGQTEVSTTQGPRLRPERGRTGKIERRLCQTKDYLASSACVLWRRAAFPAAPFDASYRAASSLLLALALSVAHDKPFTFQPGVVARATNAPDDLAAVEEKAKIFVAILYGPRALDDKLEHRVRLRLARHLVAIGKHHYRKGDHVKAGKFIGEAVKAAPSYFKGRRYQFLNFVRRVFAWS